MSAFLDMGGYAAFVWPAYGVAAVVLIGLAVFAQRSYRARRVLLEDLEKDAPDQAGGKGP